MSLDSLEAARAFRVRNGTRIFTEFADLLRIPNVTGQVADLRDNTEELVQRFSSRGGSLEIVELEGASPVVVGELRCSSPTATIGVYVHYDGQPVDPANWSVPPFSAALLSRALHDGGEVIEYPADGEDIDPEWRIYARGASDDKAPFAALTAAVDALESAGLAAPSRRARATPIA